MSSPVRVIGAGAIDVRGVVGSFLEPFEFEASGPAGVRWKDVFSLPNPSFRRLDLFGKCVCLCAEAAGAGRLLDEKQRKNTALVLASRFGCLHSDLRFAGSLAPGERVEPAVFPYTLPSTCLGELAIRHRFQGPLLALISTSAGEGPALFEAQELVATGEAAAALVCIGDCLPEEEAARIGLEPRLALTTLLLTGQESGSPTLLDWTRVREAADPLGVVSAALWGDER